MAECHDHARLTAVVNSGDDFRHLGLEIWPDWDTVVYHLSGLVDRDRGWGRANETSECLGELKRLGGPDWFYLGDRDLALHLFRTEQLQGGRACEQVEEQLADRLGAPYRVVRATRTSLWTKLRSEDGTVWEFQDWFVRQQCGPTIASVEVCDQARTDVNPQALSAIEECDLVLLSPSNPYLSLRPILSCPPLFDAIARRRASVWAVSPLLDGKATKGPLDRLIASLSQRRGQEAIVEAVHRWAKVLFLPTAELKEPLHRLASSRDLDLVGAETRLQDEYSRAKFYQDLAAAWERRR